jgi:hypothetical protein
MDIWGTTERIRKPYCELDRILESKRLCLTASQEFSRESEGKLQESLMIVVEITSANIQRNC